MSYRSFEYAEGFIKGSEEGFTKGMAWTIFVMLMGAIFALLLKTAGVF